MADIETYTTLRYFGNYLGVLGIGNESMVNMYTKMLLNALSELSGFDHFSWCLFTMSCQSSYRPRN
jgi:hypothetical protein